MESRHHGGRRGDGDDGDDANGRDFEFTFDCSIVEAGGAGSFIEPDATSTSSNSNWSDNRNDSASLSDSVRTFPEEFGRTYHAYRAGSYAFPNDTPEQERLQLQGECIKRLLDDRLYLAPLSTSRPPCAILDVATGVGDWAIQMGDLFPESMVIGTDLSPIQPADVPPNVHFYVEDSTDPWDFSQQFDYIHTRATSGSWAAFEAQIAEQAFTALEPGGWFESQEVDCNVCCDDGTLDPNGPVAAWFNDLIAASEKLNRPAIFGATLKEVFERVGFVDVQQRIFKMPIGGWAKDTRLKEIGYMWGINLLEGMAGFSYQLFNKAFERTSAQIEVSLIDVRRDLTNPRIHCYVPTFVVWGRKPYPGEV
ncbi:S-adenosyl-L-methionine-dependent methyltransferase [Thelonectria olida]|uniref:S-adenosyl-L-methionine-dependent methyltransferase n=1 Tax=Thelonectria olida TaxID=1576542 RepID=A0A9P8VWN0_9HYPO|nr:S-adenosyl-L-methionine-dependent methyltransferase [Thelonectria olida]